MGKVRVLIVDDSVIVRRVLADVLSADGGLEVVGVARDGRVALERVAALEPDIVVLDIEMPDMDGLEALSEIRARWPHLPVIMFCNATPRGAAVALDSLALGASDYLTKSPGVAGPEEAVRHVRDELIPRIKALCVRDPGEPRGPDPARRPSDLAAGAAGPARATGIGLVALGASTGGPNALAEILPALPADFPVPVLVVQHMPPVFTRMLAERLDARSAVRVAEAVHGEPLLPGRVYVAPGERHLAVGRVPLGKCRVVLTDAPRENSCRPSVDVLFRSAALAFPRATLAVILTGLGADGLKGCAAVAAAAGWVYAQDEPTSVVWGMPGSVVRAGLADRVLPLESIGRAIVSRVLTGQPAAAPAGR